MSGMNAYVFIRNIPFLYIFKSLMFIYFGLPHQAMISVNSALYIQGLLMIDIGEIYEALSIYFRLVYAQ